MDVQQWFYSVPRFTRYWFAASVGLSLLARFGLLQYSFVVLDSELVFHKFQIWRLVSSLFCYPVSFGWLIHLYFLVSYSQRLEQVEFATRPADYAFLLLFNWFFCLMGLLFMGGPFLMPSMVMSVLYIWCQLNKETIVTFWFGTQFQAKWFPLIYMGLELVIGKDWVLHLIGILAGHLYLFLKYEYPNQYGGRSLLETPDILRQWFPSPSGWTGSTGSGVHVSAPAPEQSSRAFPNAWARDSTGSSGTSRPSSTSTGTTTHRFPGRGQSLGDS